MKKYFYYLLFIIIFITPLFGDMAYDINKISKQELEKFIKNNQIAEKLILYRNDYGSFSSIYELWNINGMTKDIFLLLKENCSLIPLKEVSRSEQKIEYLKSKLASEDSPREGAIDLWENLLMYPMDINNATYKEIANIDRVNNVDAAAIVNHRKKWGTFRYVSNLNHIEYLTHYGTVNLRDYIRVGGDKYLKPFYGYFRTNIESENQLPYFDCNISALIAVLNSSISDLSDTGDTYSALFNAGWTDNEIVGLRNDLSKAKSELTNIKMLPNISEKLKFGYRDKITGGASFFRRNGRNELIKGYLSVSNYPFLKNLILGNYRVTFNNGLMIDNTDEVRSRILSRTDGIFGDLTSNREFMFKGAATELNIWNFNFIGFYSNAERDAILNRDTTSFNMLIDLPYDLSIFNNKVTETTYGGKLDFNLGRFQMIPAGTFIGVEGLNISYDKLWRPSAEELDIPGDANSIIDPNYTTIKGDSTLQFLGGYFKTVIKNSSVDLEYIKSSKDGYAFTGKVDIIFNDFFLNAMYRDYDVVYFNPYMRGFMEQDRFDDGLFEKDYRLLNPLYSYLQDFPSPKSEKGIYLGTRYKFSQSFTITHLYIDLWQNKAYSINNYRVQGELEYRPIFPLHIRLKGKYQSKYLYKEIEPTNSRTFESTFRVFATFPNRDYLNTEIRYGQVHLTPNPKYGYRSLINGGYINTSFDHKFSSNLSLIGGIAVWKTNGMSQWIFEDTGIDFLYGNGHKFYLTFSDNINKNLYIRLKYRYKSTIYNHSGMETTDYPPHFENGDPKPIRPFVDYQNENAIYLEVDLRW
jgi:DNA uptake protein ComE-like DNA-binding protein